MQETGVQSPGQEDPLEKEMATHSCILAWEIPWAEEPGRLQSMGLKRVRHDGLRHCVLCLVIQSLWADLPSEPPGKSRHGTAVYNFSPNLRTY